jgi:adenylate cyclase
LTIVEKKELKTTFLLLVFSFVAAHLCFYFLPDIFETWNLKITDRLFRFRSTIDRLSPPYDDTIVHVDLNNSSIRAMNEYYLNRSHHARVIRNLSAMDADAILYDYIFAARSSAREDINLIKTVRDSGNVYVGLALELSSDPSRGQAENLPADAGIVLDETKWSIISEKGPGSLYYGINPLPTFRELAKAAKGMGYLSLTSDRDGVYRRLPLLVRYQDAFYPSLAFRAACDYLNVTPDRIIVRPGKTITLKDVQKPGAPGPGDIVIPIDDRGRMLINYIGPWERMKHYNFVDVYLASEDQDELEMWRDEMSGKIVIVSEVTTGSSDIGPVPTDTNFPLSGLHANVIHTILTGNFIRKLTPYEMVVIEIIVLVLILVFSLGLSSLYFSIGTIAISFAYHGIAAFSFFHGSFLFHFLRPVLMAGVSLVLILSHRYIQEEKKKEFLRKTFESYFPPAIVKKLVMHPEMVRLEGHKKELTVLFSDLVNFTAYTSRMVPDRVQRLLNEYFEAMTEIVFNHGGTVDKFMGDGLMVFFGDPEPQPDHALRCVRAAIEMQQKARQITAKWEHQGDMPLKIRIGINTGEVVVGNMGSSLRLSYTVLGSEVNLAQRLESNAPVGGILISEQTNAAIDRQIKTNPLGQINVKGFENAITVFEVPIHH